MKNGPVAVTVSRRKCVRSMTVPQAFASGSFLRFGGGQRVAPKDLFARKRQRFQGFFHAQPADFANVGGRSPNGVSIRLHAPELNDLGAAAALIGDCTEEFLNADIVARFFDHLSLRG